VEAIAQNAMRQLFHARALCSHQPSSVNDRRLEVVSVRAVRVLLSGIQKLTYFCSNLRDSYTNLIKELLGISPDGAHKLQPRPKTLWSRPPDSPQKPVVLRQRSRPASADPRVLRRRDEVAALQVEVRVRPASAVPRSPYSAKKLEMDEDKLYPADVDKWDYLHNISRHRARLNKAIAISKEVSGEATREGDQKANAQGPIQPKLREAPVMKRSKAAAVNKMNTRNTTRRLKIQRHVCAACAEKFAGERAFYFYVFFHQSLNLISCHTMLFTAKIIPSTASIDPSKLEELRGRLLRFRQQELVSGKLTHHQMRILESSLHAQHRKEVGSQANQKLFCSWACARQWNNINTPPQLRYYSNILIDLMD
jgi:hypothetical protein